MNDIASGHKSTDEFGSASVRDTFPGVVPLLPWIADAPSGDSSALPDNDEVRSTSSLRSKNGSRISPKRTTKRRKTTVRWSGCDVARAPSNDFPVIHLESEKE